MKRIVSPQLETEDSLQRIPFFRGLPPEVLSAVADKLHYEHYDRGETVFVEGSAGDSLYLIDSGQVKIWTGSRSEEKIINYLGPGNFFGEMAPLLNQRRSANVTVVIDADFWVLRKADLDDLLERYPAIALQLSRELSRRLVETLQQPTRREIYNLVAVVGERPWRLAASLARLTGERIVVFDVSEISLADRIDEDLPPEVVVLDAMPGLSEEELAESLGILVEAYDRVMLAIGPERCDVGLKALQLSEVVVLIGTLRRPWMADLSTTPAWLVADTPEGTERAARHLAGRVVGLALSSGGARGLAHVGVLRVLERERIPIDVLAGTSVGSLVGGLYAAGHPVDSITRFALHFQNKLTLRGGLLDLNLPPRTGLIKGGRLRNYLEQVFGGVCFEDLETPFYVVAADLLTGEEIVFDSGPVADAVRASTSIIGLVSPYQYNGRYLVDGGAVNPLPASVLAEKGANIIIASRAIPTLEGEREGARTGRRWKSLNNILGVLSNYQSIMEREIIKTRLSPVDVLIHPEVEIYTAMDYSQASDFIRLGEEAAERMVEDIKRRIYAPGNLEV
jgi:predicted acylesterase/phospholipase RssA/CRP-like cAMP-binding protein